MWRQALQISILALAAACGDVKHAGDAGGNGGGDGGNACDPGAAIRCDGDDLIACGQDGMSEDQIDCEISCDPAALACTCEPDTVTCSGTTELVCDSEGHAAMTQCAFGCFDDTRCADIDPSNRLTQFLDDAESGSDLVLPEGTIVDTDDGRIIIDGLDAEIPSILLEAPVDPGGIQVRVFPVGSLSVTGGVVTQGAPALAFVSDRDIEIHGIVRALAGDGIDGIGGGDALVVCNPDPATGHISGRGGGGFGGRGGAGGNITGGPNGGAGGEIVGTETLIPLRGGGQDPSFQGGGGSLQLVSRSRVLVTDGGAINAGGKAGLDNRTGGTAGGGILIEAPVVVLAGAGSALAANGGGGGCGGGTMVTQSAEDGRLDAERAAGCQSTDRGDGGRGGAGETPNGLPGQDMAGCPMVAGQGGGGVGRIRINTADGTFAPADGAIVSPPASLGTVGVR